MHEIAAKRAIKKAGVNPKTIQGASRSLSADSVRQPGETPRLAGLVLSGGYLRAGPTCAEHAAHHSMQSALLVYLPTVWQSPNSVPHPAPEAEEVYRRWLQFLDDEFIRHSSPERRSEIVRDQLHQLYLGRPHGTKSTSRLTSELPGTILALSLDPANVTLEAEYFADTDRERYAGRKPLLWFWKMFDRSPIGLNHWLGLRFRCMLGRHIFDHLGAGVKIYHGVELNFGYNLSIGDGVIIRQGALLNDRGGLTIGEGAVIGSFSRIFSTPTIRRTSRR